MIKHPERIMALNHGESRMSFTVFESPKDSGEFCWVALFCMGFISFLSFPRFMASTSDCIESATNCGNRKQAENIMVQVE